MATVLSHPIPTPPRQPGLEVRAQRQEASSQTSWAQFKQARSMRRHARSSAGNARHSQASRLWPAYRMTTRVGWVEAPLAGVTTTPLKVLVHACPMR
eukprot:353972-Chlamydomonas_euryale.AAC.9